VKLRHEQPQTPPWLEQHPCLFAQLVHVGESVPSQQRKVPDAGAATEMKVVRCREPQPPVVAKVIMSEPDRVPVYVTARLVVPAEADKPLPRVEESVQLPIFATLTVIIVVCPC